MFRKVFGMVVLVLALGAGWWIFRATAVPSGTPYVKPKVAVQTPVQPVLPPYQQKMLANLDNQLVANLIYDGAYTSNGKPKPGTGVCTDVVLDAAESIGIDLQREITKEVKAEPVAYGVERPDQGIDHRRCRTMIFWFKRHADSKSPSEDFQPGDVVFYQTSGKGMIDHVGVVGGHIGADGLPTLVHHWPGQPVTEIENPMTWTVAGHFRFRK